MRPRRLCEGLSALERSSKTGFLVNVSQQFSFEVSTCNSHFVIANEPLPQFNH